MSWGGRVVVPGGGGGGGRGGGRVIWGTPGPDIVYVSLLCKL